MYWLTWLRNSGMLLASVARLSTLIEKMYSDYSRSQVLGRTALRLALLDKGKSVHYCMSYSLIHCESHVVMDTASILFSAFLFLAFLFCDLGMDLYIHLNICFLFLFDSSCLCLYPLSIFEPFTMTREVSALFSHWSTRLLLSGKVASLFIVPLGPHELGRMRVNKQHTHLPHLTGVIVTK